MPRTGLAMSDSEDSIHESVVSSTTSSERRLNLPDGIRRTISTEEIREYFECPICYEVPRPGSSIFACPQGHMICNECIHQLSNCPICRTSISNRTVQRLYMIERLLEEKVPAQCKFQQLGCEVELVGHLLMQHENGRCPYEPVTCDYDHRGCRRRISRAQKSEHLQKCDYRLVNCPMPSCKETLVKKQLAIHLERAHRNGDPISNKTLLIMFLISIVLNIFLMFFYVILGY